MKCKIITGLLLISSLAVFPQKIKVVSPNKKIVIGLFNTKNSETGEWYLGVKYSNNSKGSSGW